MAQPFLTAPQVAQGLRANPRTVRLWLKLGKLKGSNPTGQWRVSVPDYVEFKRRLEGGDLPTQG